MAPPPHGRTVPCLAAGDGVRGLRVARRGQAGPERQRPARQHHHRRCPHLGRPPCPASPALRTAQARPREEQRRREEEIARKARIDTLQKRLAEAVAAEQYERAAQLRDELKRAENGGGTTLGSMKEPDAAETEGPRD